MIPQYDPHTKTLQIDLTPSTAKQAETVKAKTKHSPPVFVEGMFKNDYSKIKSVLTVKK